MRLFLKIVGWVGGILGVIALILYATLFDIWTVPIDDPQAGVAGLPTLAAGDVVLVTRRSTTSFGSLVRCTDPDSPSRFIVGRVVGLSHDAVDLVDESLSVNGKHEASSGQCESQVVTMKVPATGQDIDLRCLRQEFAGTEIEFLYTNDHPEGATHAVVEPGRAFLLSDNRHLHLDSRDFGQVVTTTCQHVVYRLVGAEGWTGAPKRRLSFLW